MGTQSGPNRPEMTHLGHGVHRLSVVVCTRDRPALLEGCLIAARAALRPGDELVVVDSASLDPDPVEAVVRRMGARYVRAERPGLSLARNRGWKAARAPLVAFTDDDCLPGRSWADALVTGFERPGVDFVTGPVTAEGDVRLPVSVVTAAEPREFGPGTDPVACGAGANMAFRTEALDAIGGFDELLGAGAPLRAGEDLDAFARLLRLGHLGRYVPEAALAHVQWRTDAGAVALGWGYGLGAGAVAVKAGREGSGWSLLRHRLGRDGVGAVARALRERHWTGLATSLLQLSGTVAGAARTARRPIVNGRYA